MEVSLTEQRIVERDLHQLNVLKRYWTYCGFCKHLLHVIYLVCLEDQKDGRNFTDALSKITLSQGVERRVILCIWKYIYIQIHWKWTVSWKSSQFKDAHARTKDYLDIQMAQEMNSAALANSRWWFVVLVCDIFKAEFLWSAQHWTRVHIPAQSNSECLANWTVWLAEHSDISFWKRNDTLWNETSSRLFHCHCWRGKIL